MIDLALVLIILALGMFGQLFLRLLSRIYEGRLNI